MSVEPVRVWNPPNPYLTEHRELIGEPPPVALEVYEDQSQEILSHNDSPDIGFRWSVNPYRGCFHACSYCFSRPTHEYFGLGAGTDFERKIFIKKNASALLERAFRRRSPGPHGGSQAGAGWQGERIVFSGVTDCYQPLEAAWKLTRGCLETCLKFRNPAGIITKSALIRRDADILQGLAREASVGVSISIPFLDEETTRKVEPGAPAIHKRFETLKILADAGIPVGIGVAPIIPGLNDRDIPGLLKRAKECGAKFAFHTLLRLPGSVREVFLHRIRRDLPLKARRIEERVKDSRGGAWYDSRFGHRHSGQGNYWEAIEQQWEIWTERLGFSERDEEPERPSTFRRPPAPAGSSPGGPGDPAGQLEFNLDKKAPDEPYCL